MLLMRQLACMAQTMYERKQLDFETEQLLNYVARPTINVYKKS